MAKQPLRTIQTSPNLQNFIPPPPESRDPTGKIVHRYTEDNSLLIEILPGQEDNYNYGFGLVKSPNDNGIYVTNVESNSNFKDILSVGDEILEIDNRSCHEQSLMQVTGMLCNNSRRLIRILPKPCQGSQLNGLQQAFLHMAPADGQVRNIGSDS